jgi:type I restriction enzyme R subunit
MTTGIDAQTCKLIVLDRRINSMTEFKQIIGRGSRINEDYNKHWFTILDFKKATELFADPNFDGDPVQVYQPEPDEPINPADETETAPDDVDAVDNTGPGGTGEDVPPYTDEPETPWGTDDIMGPWAQPGESGGEQDSRPSRYVVDDVTVEVIAERVQYLDANGELITESLTDYTRKRVKEQYASLGDFLKRWQETDRKQAIIDELAEQGIFWDDLLCEVGKKLGEAPDPFDVICHIVYDQSPLSRRERAEIVRNQADFSHYSHAARQVLDGLLDKYADAGVESIEDPKVLEVNPFSQLGSPTELIRAFGKKADYDQAVRELEDALYQPPASA